MKIRAVVLVIFLVPMCALAAKGSDLLKLCESADPTSRQHCEIYVRGVVQGGLAMQPGLASPTSLLSICVPADVSGREGRLIFVDYANKNPQDLYLWDAGIVLLAFSAAFPCQSAE